MSNLKNPDLVYPLISFGDAIIKVKLIYQNYSKRLVSKHEAAKAMRYSGLNGSSYTTISALIQYGLVEAVGKELKVGEDAVNIIDPKEDNMRSYTIQKLAFRPPLFQELHKSYPSLDNFPVEEVWSYIKGKGVALEGVDDLMHLYRSTLEFVETEAKGTLTEFVGQQKEDSMHSQLKVAQDINRIENSATSTRENGSGEQVLSLKLPNCDVYITYNDDISPRSLDQVIAHLKLLRDYYSKEK